MSASSLLVVLNALRLRTSWTTRSNTSTQGGG
jgi:cation transport ATPase